MGDLDIRGKITEIDAKKKFHLIQDHRGIHDDSPPIPGISIIPTTKTTLLKLFFGLEVGCGRRRSVYAAGGAYAANYNNNNAEFMDYEEDEKMMDED